MRRLSSKGFPVDENDNNSVVGAPNLPPPVSVRTNRKISSRDNSSYAEKILSMQEESLSSISKPKSFSVQSQVPSGGNGAGKSSSSGVTNKLAQSGSSKSESKLPYPEPELTHPEPKVPQPEPKLSHPVPKLPQPKRDPEVARRMVLNSLGRGSSGGSEGKNTGVDVYSAFRSVALSLSPYSVAVNSGVVPAALAHPAGVDSVVAPAATTQFSQFPPAVRSSKKSRAIPIVYTTASRTASSIAPIFIWPTFSSGQSSTKPLQALPTSLSKFSIPSPAPSANQQLPSATPSVNLASSPSKDYSKAPVSSIKATAPENVPVIPKAAKAPVEVPSVLVESITPSVAHVQTAASEATTVSPIPDFSKGSSHIHRVGIDSTRVGLVTDPSASSSNDLRLIISAKRSMAEKYGLVFVTLRSVFLVMTTVW